MKIERRKFLELTGVALAAMTVRGQIKKPSSRPLPKSEYDYVDWSWGNWRKITRAVRPSVSGERTGKAELIDLLETNGKRITTPNEWQTKREEIKKRLNVFLGDAPKTKPPLQAKVLEETERENHVLRKLVYQTEPGEFVPSYLLIPKNLKVLLIKIVSAASVIRTAATRRFLRWHLTNASRRARATAVSIRFALTATTWRWSRATALIPLLGFYISNPRLNMDFYRAVPDSSVVDVPFEMHELLALIAPRPLLLSTSDEDFVFPNGGWSACRAIARIEPVYELLGAKKNLSSYFFKGGHNFPPEASANAYAWLEHWLKS